MTSEFRFAQTPASIYDTLSRAIDPKLHPVIETVAGLMAFRDHDLEDFLSNLPTGGDCGCTDANLNTKVGAPAALANLTTGSNNVVVGANTLSGTVTGDNNVAVGEGSGTGGGDGSRNTWVGTLSGFNSGGDDNVAFGFDTTLGGSVSGAVVIGSDASGLGDNSVAVGGSSIGRKQGVSVGAGATVTAKDSVAIGFSTVTVATRTVAAGSACGSDAASPDSIVIGNGSAATGAPFGIAIGSGVGVTASGAIGIGGASNTANLAVIGTAAHALTVGNPGGGAGAWQLGTVKAAAVALDATHYVEVSIGGVVVKLAIVT